MAKSRVQYVCQSCGASTVKWAGQCKACGEWNTLEETVVQSRHDPSISRACSFLVAIQFCILMSPNQPIPASDRDKR